MPTYRQIISKAMALAWRNPNIWLFGLFVAFMGSGGEAEVIRQNIDAGRTRGLLTELIGGFFQAPSGVGFFEGLADVISNQPANFIFALILLLVVISIGVSIVFLITSSQGALIYGLINAAKNKSTTIGEDFKFGVSRFVSLLGFNLIGRTIEVSLLALLTYLAIYVAKSGNEQLFFILIFIVFITAVTIASFLTKFAIFFSVLKNNAFDQAWKNSWELFKKNWILILEIAFTLFIIFWVFNTAALVVITFAFYYAIQWYLAFPAAILLTAIAFALLFIMLQVFLTVFFWGTWVLTFELLLSKKVMLSRIVSAWQKIFKS